MKPLSISLLHSAQAASSGCSHSADPETRTQEREMKTVPGQSDQHHFTRGSNHRADRKNRPAKAQFVQYHITSDDLANRARSLSIQDAINIQSGYSRHQNRETWPARSQERVAGRLAFDTPPRLVRTPWEADRSRSRSIRPRHKPLGLTLPGRIFAQLPRDIYHAILKHLQAVHSRIHEVKVIDWQADLRSLSLVDKRWHRIAREHLYGELWVPLCKPIVESKKYRLSCFQQPRNRLRQLIDVLAASPGLASLVRQVRIPTLLGHELKHECREASRRTAMLQLLEELIFRCPNLEHVDGYIPPLSAATSNLFEALSSRPKLKAHAWQLGSPSRVSPPLMDFIHYHDHWANLETLVLCGDPSESLGPGIVSAVLTRLPSLQHLMLARLHRKDFQNTSLLLLPALKSLRLESLAGVTDQGVEQLAHCRLAGTMERLSLIRLELASLHTIKALLVHMTRLREFTLVQDTSPEPLFGMRLPSMVRDLGSASLRFLHWDCLIPGSALSYIEHAIERNNFPGLNRVKIPCDHDGVIQALCRPVPREKFTSEDLEFYYCHRKKDQNEHSLWSARIQAQIRMRESQQRPAVNVVVQDEKLVVQHTHVIGKYIGKMESQIKYDLQPAIGQEALVGFTNVASPLQSSERNWEPKVDVGLLF